jgi:hypothetical protein
METASLTIFKSKSDNEYNDTGFNRELIVIFAHY